MEVGLQLTDGMENMDRPYDVIIAGAGLSGLSLAWQIRQSGMRELRILLIDQANKQVNDRTWCWWERGSGPFEPLVYRSWDTIRVTSADGKAMQIPLGSYRYKMIRGIDMYRFMEEVVHGDPNILRLTEPIESIHPEDQFVHVRTASGSWTGLHLFDSTHRMPMTDPHSRHLLQHFLGYVIQSPTPVFTPQVPDLMNFHVPETGDCRFIYILPFSETEALVEYTLFTGELLKRDEYVKPLEQWINQHLGLSSYRILEEEFGVIPMSDEPVSEFPHPRVTRIGTAGGYTNPATGYTFATTQKRLGQLVRHFLQTGQWQAGTPIRHRRFDLYASVLLDVLSNGDVAASKVFWDLYRHNPIDRVFRFLDGESTFGEELRLMLTTPYLPFTKAGGQVLRRRIL